LPDLRYYGAGKQLTLLAKHLPKDRFEMRLCVLSGAGPLLGPLAEAIPVELLNYQRLIDIRPLTRFREVVRKFEPQVIHAWRKVAWRFACLAELLSSRAIILTSGEMNQQAKPCIQLLDRLFLRRVGRITALSEAEADFYRSQGFLPGQVSTVLPAVEQTTIAATCAPEEFNICGVPQRGRIIACIGPLEMNKGFDDAIWAFDILKYLYDDVHLVIVGDGPDRDRIECYARAGGHYSDIHFIGLQPDISPMLARADVIWIPSRVGRGLNVALESMAASRPVVAASSPALAEIVIDGETGLLYRSGDKIELARHTRRLFDDAGLRARLIASAKERAALRFSTANAAEKYAAIYESVVRSFG
jgi:glycosyltransferase involved in cell wall biosynthesis